MFAIIKAFVAGILSALTFHQALLWVLRQYGLVEHAPWNMAPVPPFGVPAVVSLALWGGLWAILLWLMIRRALAAGYYVGAIILGAILPSLVALTLVPWLKGQPVDAVMAGWALPHIGIALALNGAWGLGVAVFMRVMQPPR